MPAGPLFFPAKSVAENENLAEKYEDWALLEIERGDEAKERFSYLKIERRKPRVVPGATSLKLEMYRVNPLHFGRTPYELEKVPATLKRRSQTNFLTGFADPFESLLGYIRVFSIEDTFIRHGNSGSPLLADGKVYAMLGLAAEKKDWSAQKI